MLKVFISIGDQVLFSGANYVVFVYLARIVSVEDYGIISAAQSVYLFFFTINHAVMLEPLNNIIVKLDKEEGIFQSLFITQLGFAGMLSILNFIGGLVVFFFHREIAMCLFFISVVIMTSSILLQAKRISYFYNDPLASLRISIVYCIVIVILIIGLRELLAVNAALAFAAIGMAGLIALTSSPYVRKATTSVVGQARSLFALFWTKGKWMLIASVVAWISSSIFVPMAAIIGKVTVSAQLRALENILLPFDQILTALAVFLFPAFFKQYEKNRSLDALKRQVYKKTSFLLVPTALVVFLLWLFGEQILSIVYGENSPYQNLETYVPIVGLNLVLRVLGDFGLVSVLRVTNNFKVLMYPSLVTSVLSITVGSLLLLQFDIAGGVLARLLVMCVQVLLLYLFTAKFVAVEASEVK